MEKNTMECGSLMGFSCVGGWGCGEKRRGYEKDAFLHSLIENHMNFPFMLKSMTLNGQKSYAVTSCQTLIRLGTTFG